MLPMSLADAFDRRQPKHCRLRSDAWQAAENSSARPGVGEPANAIAQISRSRTTETRNGGAGAARGAVNEARSARLLSPRTPPGVLDGTPLPLLTLLSCHSRLLVCRLSIPLPSLFQCLPCSSLSSVRIKSNLH